MRSVGIRRAAFLGELKDGRIPADPAFRELLEGFLAAGASGPRIEKEWIVHAARCHQREETHRGALRLVRLLHKKKPASRVEGVFVADYSIAGVFLKAFREYAGEKISLPEIWTVSGPANGPLPVRNACDFNPEQMGRKGVARLLRRIRGERDRPTLERIAPVRFPMRPVSASAPLAPQTT